MSHPFHCPVRVIEGDAFSSLKDVLADRTFILITSAGWLPRGIVSRLAAVGLNPLAVVSNIQPNPTVQAIRELATLVKGTEAVVAFGGGSVIDAAKGSLTLAALRGDLRTLNEHLRTGAALPENIELLSLIAVPTTAGTGSEVTRWGTIWGENHFKYSVNDSRLFPTHAILDPTLLVSMPRSLKLATSLDALSHAMESIWNKRHSAATDALAQSAISLLFRNLDASLSDTAGVEVLQKIQTAALLAGLAMSTTQTALAHSISYPFTSRFGLPHGLACSFSLAEVARYNIHQDAVRMTWISDGLGCEVAGIPAAIEKWFEQLGVAKELKRYLNTESADQFDEELITPARAANNLRSADGKAAREIARTALHRILPRAA